MVAATTPPRTIDQLREATEAMHAALDAAIDLTDYPRFLTATYGAIEQLEPAVARWLADLVHAERVPALRADLRELATDPGPPVAPPAIASESEAFGAAYVMEGSTLGGLVLADRVGSPASRYLRLRGKTTAARWKHFLSELDERVIDQAGCVRVACATFDHYRAAYRRFGVIP